MDVDAYRLPRILVVVLLGATLIGCAQPKVQPPQPTVEALVQPAREAVSAQQAERDEIYMLLAYAVVLKDWQTDATEPRRGHNIGSVLVDPQGEVVFWARNCNYITGNGTQHGEVRLIRNRLAETKKYYLKDHTVYTTLEPCAMCSGMMVLTKVMRTVYGQTDPGYGKALERLALDSRSLPDGYAPYPRAVVSEASASSFRKRLDDAYARYEAGGGRSITGWLRSSAAKAIYQDAFDRFQRYQVRYPKNQIVLDRARAYYETVPNHYVELTQ
jgi:tRNA(adenine34) deaminase